MKFKIRIEPSGHEFGAAKDETILAAALRNGYVLPYSCRDGACGTCKGKLLSGRVDYGGYQEHALSEGERAAGMALFCQAVPLEDLVIEVHEVGAAKDVEVKTLPCRVARMRRLAADVMEIHLKLPQNRRLQFLAGQYIDILLKDGRRRSFSLANAPHDNELLHLHIRHVPGGYFTGHVFDGMQEKDMLRFQGPLGTFFLREDSTRPIILMAGGTGFAPIKGLVEHALYLGTQRRIHLFWGARTREGLYMNGLARSWAEGNANFHYTPVLSEPDPGWEGSSGWVHGAVVQDYPDLSGPEVYASGPPAMIEAAKGAFMARGLAEDRLFYDSFGYAHERRQADEAGQWRRPVG